jgi:hypothetical protein
LHQTWLATKNEPQRNRKILNGICVWATRLVVSGVWPMKLKFAILKTFLLRFSFRCKIEVETVRRERGIMESFQQKLSVQAREEVLQRSQQQTTYSIGAAVKVGQYSESA